MVSLVLQQALTGLKKGSRTSSKKISLPYNAKPPRTSGRLVLLGLLPSIVGEAKLRRLPSFLAVPNMFLLFAKNSMICEICLF